MRHGRQQLIQMMAFMVAPTSNGTARVVRRESREALMAGRKDTNGRGVLKIISMLALDGPRNVRHRGNVLGQVVPVHALNLIFTRPEGAWEVFAAMAFALDALGRALVTHVLDIGIHATFALKLLVRGLLIGKRPLWFNNTFTPVFRRPRTGNEHTRDDTGERIEEEEEMVDVVNHDREYRMISQ